MTEPSVTTGDGEASDGAAGTAVDEETAKTFASHEKVKRLTWAHVTTIRDNLDEWLSDYRRWALAHAGYDGFGVEIAADTKSGFTLSGTTPASPNLLSILWITHSDAEPSDDGVQVDPLDNPHYFLFEAPDYSTGADLGQSDGVGADYFYANHYGGTPITRGSWAGSYVTYGRQGLVTGVDAVGTIFGSVDRNKTGPKGALAPASTGWHGVIYPGELVPEDHLELFFGKSAVEANDAVVRYVGRSEVRNAFESGSTSVSEQLKAGYQRDTSVADLDGMVVDGDGGPATGSGGGGSTSSSATCRTYDPSSTTDMVVAQTEIDVGDVALTNWAGQDVYHFEYSPDSPNCRSPSAITGVVLHDTATPDWASHRAKLMEHAYVDLIPVEDDDDDSSDSGSNGDDGSDGESSTKKWCKVSYGNGQYKPYSEIPEGAANRGDDLLGEGPSSTHLVVKRDGTVEQHNDLVDELYHGTILNDTTIGLDLVAAHNNLDTSFSAQWAGGTYYHPTKAQCETTLDLIEWLTDSSLSHGLSIDRSWPAIDTANDRYYVDHYVDEVSGASSPGMWAHAHYESNRHDGFFAALYTWLALEGDLGQDLSEDEVAAKAFTATKTVLKDGSPSLQTETTGGRTRKYFDIGEYTGESGP